MEINQYHLDRTLYTQEPVVGILVMVIISANHSDLYFVITGFVLAELESLLTALTISTLLVFGRVYASCTTILVLLSQCTISMECQYTGLYRRIIKIMPLAIRAIPAYIKSLFLSLLFNTQ